MREAGFTLIEVAAASLIAAVVASATMMAYVTAARLPRTGDDPSLAEARSFTLDTFERFRNRISADSPWPASEADGAWRKDPLPAAGSTESILDVAGVAARRCYRLTPEDCDGDGLRSDPSTPGEVDCYAIDVKVCWKNVAGCLCPP